jgi:beta-lactamase regulating signal transducer with metallopeptidase domain
MIDRIFSEQIIESVGWAVVHSLWQSTLIAIFLAVAFSFIGKEKAGRRYQIAFGGLLIAFFAFVGTFLLYYSSSGNEVSVAGVAGQSLDVMHTEAPSAIERMSSSVRVYLPVIFNVWVLGLIIVGIKMFGGWIYIEKIKRRVSKEIPGHYHQIVSRIKAQLGVRKKILVGVSERVAAPIVAGFIKPIILIPVGLVNQLNDREVEAILTHEIAHIRRNDYLFNLIQSVIETILYFNPAIWWISSAVRNTREHCCDDMAIQYCGDQLMYAGALVKAEEMRASVNLRRPYALSFLGQKENLLNRIKRILQQPEKNAIAMEKILMSAGLLLCMVFFNLDQNRDQKQKELAALHEQVVFNSILPTITVVDTIPSSMVEKITRKENDQEIEATYENGVMTELKINGQIIPEGDRKDYTEEIKKLESERSSSRIFNFESHGNTEYFETLKKHLHELRSIEEMEFSFPDFEDFNLDENIRFGIELDGGAFKWNGGEFKSFRIETEQTEDGKTIMRIQTDEDDEPKEFEIGENEEDVIIIDGREIRIGDATRMLDDLDQYHGFKLKPEGGMFYIEEFHDYEELMDEARQQMKELREQQRMTEKEYYNQLERNKKKWNDEQLILRDQMREIKEEEMARIREEMARAREKAREMERDDLAIGYLKKGEAYEIEGNPNNVYFRSGRDVNSALERELFKDGFIKNGEAYSLKFNGGKLKINGKKQPDEIYEKYRDIYESHTGTDISKSKIIIEN